MGYKLELMSGQFKKKMIRCSFCTKSATADTNKKSARQKRTRFGGSCIKNL